LFFHKQIHQKKSTGKEKTMEMKRSTACMLMLIFMLVPLGVLAKNSQPFALIDGTKATVEMVSTRYWAMDRKSPEWKEFIRLSSAFTGYTEAEFDMIIKTGGYEIKSCGTCELLSYEFLPNSESKPRRGVTPLESVVNIIVDKDHSIPWFLPRCMNPVEKPKTQPVSPPVTTTERVKSNCCWDSGPPIVTRGSLIPGAVYGYTSFWGGVTTISPAPQFGSIFYPTTCSGEMFKGGTDK
jgi:hypothetical protein